MTVSAFFPFLFSNSSDDEIHWLNVRMVFLRDDWFTYSHTRHQRVNWLDLLFYFSYVSFIRFPYIHIHLCGRYTDKTNHNANSLSIPYIPFTKAMPVWNAETIPPSNALVYVCQNLNDDIETAERSIRFQSFFVVVSSFFT